MFTLSPRTTLTGGTGKVVLKINHHINYCGERFHSRIYLEEVAKRGGEGRKGKWEDRRVGRVRMQNNGGRCSPILFLGDCCNPHLHP